MITERVAALEPTEPQVPILEPRAADRRQTGRRPAICGSRAFTS